MTDAPEGSSLGPRGREDHLASWQERALERATQRFEQGWSVEAVEDDVIPHEGRRDDPSKHFKAMRKQVLAELPHMVGDVLQGRDHAQAPKSLGEALRKARDIEQVTSYRRSRLGITAEEEVALRMAELRERNSSLGPRSLSSRTGRGELGSILREQQSSRAAQVLARRSWGERWKVLIRFDSHARAIEPGRHRRGSPRAGTTLRSRCEARADEHAGRDRRSQGHS